MSTDEQFSGQTPGESDLLNILAVEDYSFPRTYHEFREWWFAKYHMYGSTREGILYSRDGKGLTKKFHEEAQPLLSFMATYYADSNVRCKLLAGSEQDDAFLVDSSGRVIKRLQVTYGVDGFVEHLRTTELTKSGSVDAHAKPIISGSGKSRTVVFPNLEAKLHEDIVRDAIVVIEAAAIKKKERNFSPGYALVVSFNDRSFEESDRPSFDECYRKISGWFTEVYLVGIHGIIVFPFPQKSK